MKFMSTHDLLRAAAGEPVQSPADYVKCTVSATAPDDVNAVWVNAATRSVSAFTDGAWRELQEIQYKEYTEQDLADMQARVDQQRQLEKD